jgi:hypothetical protein
MSHYRGKPEALALEQFLLDNAIHMEVGYLGGVIVNRRKLIERWGKWGISVVAAAVLVGSLSSMLWWHLYEGLSHSLLEALFLASVLTLTVDPFLKRRLVRDAARDIFHHVLGIDFAPEIRDAFQKALLGGKDYRVGTEIDAYAQRGEGNCVVLELEIRWTIVAAKRHDEYQQSLAWEEAENPTLLEVSVASESNPKVNYCEWNPPLTRNAEDPLVLEWKGPKIKLEKGDRLRSSAKYTVTGGIHDFSTFNFGAPAVNVLLRLRPSKGLSLSASRPDPGHAEGDLYSYDKVFVPGDHIQIRWKPNPSLAPPSTEKNSALTNTPE